MHLSLAAPSFAQVNNNMMVDHHKSVVSCKTAVKQVLEQKKCKFLGYFGSRENNYGFYISLSSDLMVANFVGLLQNLSLLAPAANKMRHQFTKKNIRSIM